MKREMKTGMNCILVLLVVFFSWSCIGIRYYDLFIEPNANTPPKTIDRVLQIEYIRGNEIVLDQRMVIRKNTYRVDYFPFKLWAKRADELIQDTIIQYYKNSAFFSKVVDEHFSIEPDLLMRVQLDALEIVQEEGEWYARLALDVEMSDAKSEKTLFIHTFDRKMMIQHKNIHLFPEKISLILKEELMNIIEELNKTV